MHHNLPTLLSLRKKRVQGSALIITLSLLVLLTIMVVAFVSRATLQRQVAFTSVGLSRAESLGHTSLDAIVVDLVAEIKAGSTNVTTPPDTPIYRPRETSAVMPTKSGVPAGSAPQILKISRSGAEQWTNTVYSPTTGPVRAYANNSTLSPARSGRYYAAETWNAPELLPGSPFSSASALTPLTPPDWIYVSRSGPLGPSSVSSPDYAQMGDKTSSNTNYVIGRYAYVLYEVGGLLDANIAGSHENADYSADLRGSRLSVALANLQKIDPGLTREKINELLLWRNPANHATGASDLIMTHAPESGFLEPANGDQFFAGRRDLVRYFRDRLQVPEALPFLTVFSRSLSQPDWSPPMQGSVPDPKYNINQDFLAAKVEAEFTRRDGSQTVVGEPILKTKFPLSKLELIERSATAAQDSDIDKYFGLRRSSPNVPWRYTEDTVQLAAATTNMPRQWRFMLLSEIAEEDREPNFFELLQAGILNGWQTSGNSPSGSLGGFTAGTSFDNGQFHDRNIGPHVLQLGANIIDQYDGDNYPTELEVESGPSPDTMNFVFGIEDLPYLHRVAHTTFRETTSTDTHIHFVAEIWNPHRPNVAPGAQGPTEFRWRANGPADGILTFLDGGTGQPPIYSNSTTSYDNEPADAETPTVLLDPTGTSDRVVKFSVTNAQMNAFREPKMLTRDVASLDLTNSHPLTEVSDPGVVTPSGSFAGIYVGTVNGDITFTPNKPPPLVVTESANQAVVYPKTVTFTLDYKDESGNWRPYSQMRRTRGGSHSTSRNDRYRSFRLGELTSPGSHYLINRPDPRVDRFGATVGTVSNQAGPENNRLIPFGHSIRPSTYSGPEYSRSVPTSATFQLSPADRYHVALLAQNSEATVPKLATGAGGGQAFYRDQDGIRRGADGYRAADDRDDLAYPHIPSTSATLGDVAGRPVVLNRPFRSVAELGYACRDLPWKTMDFFSDASADGGLLSIFSVLEEPVISAGRLNPNSMPPEVLNALLSEATVDVVSGRDKLTDVELTSAASKFQTAVTTNGTKFRDISDFLRMAAVDEAFFDSPDVDRVKTRSEVLARSTADLLQTRVWNLFVDLVVEAGRFPTGAQGGGDFLVEGSQRIWAHIAIDRLTGEVLSRHVEFLDSTP